VVVVWKKENGTARGGTEGFVLGVVGDAVSGEYLVIDRSTYQGSFKSNILSLGIFDLKVIPISHVEKIEEVDMRKRPPESYEKITSIVEANFKSNIDFDATWLKIGERTDCDAELKGKDQSNVEYQIVVTEINGFKGTTVNIYNTGALQITSKNERLDEVLEWIRGAIELLPEHKRLVLVQTNLKYSVWNTYREKARPTKEAIERIAKVRTKIKEDQPLVILPIGWAHEFFVKLPENPLQKLFPSGQSLRNFVIKDENRKKNIFTLPATSEGTEPKQFVDLKFPDRVGNVTKYLGAGSPIIRVSSAMENSSPEYEEHWIRRWLEMRSAPWQWLSSDIISGKMVVGDLTIDKKARILTLDLREYSSSTEFLSSLRSSGSNKSTHRK